jgi:hypothetical protein
MKLLAGNYCQSPGAVITMDQDWVRAMKSVAEVARITEPVKYVHGCIKVCIVKFAGESATCFGAQVG